VEIYLIYLAVGFCVLLIIGLFALPIIPSLDYSNPIIIDVQHTEKEYVTKTHKVVSENVPLSAVTFKKIDFSLSQGQTIKIQWSSTKQVSLVAVMKQSTWDSFYKSIVLTLGAAGATAFLSSGLSIPIVTSLLVPRLPDLLKSLGSVDYYTLNSSKDTKTLNLEAGPYRVVVFSVRTRSGSSTINLTYDYQVLEDVIKHRTETHYHSKKITVWQRLFAKNSRNLNAREVDD
jgi:hypothetical protein